MKTWMAVIGFVGIAGCGAGPEVGETYEALTGHLTSSPSSFSIDGVPVGSRAVLALTLTNSGLLPANLIDVQFPPGPCRSGGYSPSIPGGGGTGTAHVAFEPTTVGTFDCTATITYHEGTNRAVYTLTVPGTATSVR